MIFENPKVEMPTNRRRRTDEERSKNPVIIFEIATRRPHKIPRINFRKIFLADFKLFSLLEIYEIPKSLFFNFIILY
jgi:hypothetical protein